MTGPRSSVIERVFAKIDFSGGYQACWLWQGYVESNGYAHVIQQGVKEQSHRVVYKLAIGFIADGLTIDHLCMIKHCVNPLHLEPVTIGENVLRGNNRAAVNARKIVCWRGHELTQGKKQRYCKKCDSMKSQRYRERKATATAE